MTIAIIIKDDYGEQAEMSVLDHNIDQFIWNNNSPDDLYAFDPLLYAFAV